MRPALQETLLQLFKHLHDDPDSFPSVPIDEWDEGSTERHLLESFRGMAEQVQERINQLRQTEEQLIEKEAQYRSIFESTYDAVVVMDLDGFFVEVNPAFCRMFGYTREELIGKHGNLTTAPETLPVLDDFLHTFSSTLYILVRIGGREPTPM